jgi:diguanylate cyclase (GGDEF)-like protein
VLGKEIIIYIADDETNIRLAIKKFLENAGYVVEDFENGDLLMDAFCKSPADLVILDVMMPGSNGFVICKELRKISPVPVIMLTARDSDLDYATGLDLGSDDYLTKPFSPMALVMRVKALFRRMEFDRQIYTERDLMTGVYNKVSGINIAENKLRTSNEKSLHALFVIDIDNFKDINDNLGHAVGDKVIIEAAKTISNVFRDSDIVSRFGGDEFVVFAAHITDIGLVEKKATELCNALHKSYGEDENLQNISASVGIACYPVHGSTYEELFEHADETLYKVKEQGKNGFALYKGKESGKLYDKKAD